RSVAERRTLPAPKVAEQNQPSEPRDRWRLRQDAAWWIVAASSTTATVRKEAPMPSMWFRVGVAFAAVMILTACSSAPARHSTSIDTKYGIPPYSVPAD